MFDKTGTLTLGEHRAVATTTDDSLNADEAVDRLPESAIEVAMLAGAVLMSASTVIVAVNSQLLRATTL